MVGWLVGRLVGWLMVLSPCLFVSHCFTGIRRRWCREAFAHACVRLRANSYARARSHLTPWVLPRHAQIGYIYNTCPRLVSCFFYCIFCNARGDRGCVSRYSLRRVQRCLAFPATRLGVSGGLYVCGGGVAPPPPTSSPPPSIYVYFCWCVVSFSYFLVRRFFFFAYVVCVFVVLFHFRFFILFVMCGYSSMA